MGDVFNFGVGVGFGVYGEIGIVVFFVVIKVDIVG